MIGETILHYKILEKLGEGGMGVVYLAEDLKLERKVAIKFLPRRITGNSEERERFKIEAKAAAALNHPNIATIHAIEESGEDTFIVMEFIDGKELKSFVETGHAPSLQIKDVINYAIQIAEGLEAAHKKGIVHRDIKSQNIMITNDGKVKIMDFGLAKLSGATKLTQIGSTIGTAAYMSPEQALGEEVDSRSDIFSFGVVLYEMLTTKLPFNAEHQAALVYSVINETPQPVARFNDKVSEDFERIVFKALAKDKEERYQHADDIIADLRRERKNIEYARADQVSMHSATSQVKTQQPKKNFSRYYISAAILILLVVVAAYFIFFNQGSEINSIAVLPFSITSSDSSANILSDGITEGIINSLSNIPSLTVMSRNSVFRYVGENVDVKEIGKKLDVKAVLLGRIVQTGDSYAISVELVDAGNERHLWGEQYNKHASDIYSLQGEVSKDISEQLRVKLTGEEENRLARNYTENSEAYTLYLKGRFYMNKRTEEGLRKSIDYFNQAVGKDPDYALAYVGISDGYSLLADNFFIPADDGYPKAKEAVLKALDLDNNLAEAHTSLANIFGHELNNTESIREYKKAIELNPNYAEAHHWYALQLLLFGKFDEALHEIKRAQQLDPLSLRINQNVGYIYYYMRQYNKAIEWQLKTIDMDSTFPGPHALMGDVYFMKKQYNKALKSYEAETRLTGDKTTIFYSACVYGVTGQRTKALKLLDELKQLSTKKFVPTSYFMFIQLYLGNKDQAIVLLQRAVDENDPIIYALEAEPKLDPLRSYPEYNELLKKAKFIQ